MSIPKKIHYMWFSGDPKDERTLRCIDSWHKHLPDYEFIEWNADNCDVNETAFSKMAFEAKKWAHVADYFRLKKLYEHGGIYLDADILVTKSFDGLLKYSAFFPVEGYDYVINAVMGSVPGNEVIKKMLAPYESMEFKGSKQALSFMHYMTRILIDDYGFKQTGFSQVLKNNIAVFSSNVLLINVDDGDNICEHLYAGAWLDEDMAIKQDGVPIHKKGGTYKTAVFKRYYYNLFGRPNLDGIASSGARNNNKSTPLSEDILELISTVKQALNYVKQDPDKNKHLVEDLNEAAKAIASELSVDMPQNFTEDEDSLTALEEWLSSISNNTAQDSNEGALVKELKEEIVRLNNNIAVTDVSLLSFGPAKFYSTCGEDAVLLRIFYNSFTKTVVHKGTYVDIGAHHPRSGSNTYVLHKLGWSGINIEANPAAIPIFERERPNDINLNYAVGKFGGDIDFYLFGNEDSEHYGQSSTTDAEFAKRVEKAQQITAKKVVVKGKRLDDILNEHLNNKHIDFMNIDVENKELDVLESSDWNLYRPLIIAIEINPKSNSDFNIRDTLEHSQVIKMLEEYGYICFTQVLVTFFFYDSRSDRKDIIVNWTRGN